MTTNNKIDNMKTMYAKYGKKYPYACDAVAYYIFGDKSDDNILIRAYKGVYGRDKEIDSSEISSFMLNCEYFWEENIQEINNFIKNVQTNNGGKLSDFF